MLSKSVKKPGGDAPISLGGFFDVAGDDDYVEHENGFEQIYDIQEGIRIVDLTMRIRQSAWHMANANKIWPGTFALAEFLHENISNYSSGTILELGAATGALAIFLTSPPRNLAVITSDIDDNGEVEANILHNFQLNGMHKSEKVV